MTVVRCPIAMTERTARLRRALAPAALAAALAVVGAARPATAELVIFTDGSYLKVASFALSGDGETAPERMVLGLTGGGSISVPLGRIDRVVADEVVRPDSAPEELAAADLPALPVGFEEGQAVPGTPYGDLIYAAARRHRLNPALVAAVVRAESAFDPAARSTRGARGLMQLMPATGRRFGVRERDLYDAAENIEAGTRYLRWLLERFGGRLSLALAAYNAGEGTVDRYGGVPPYRETRDYLRRIYATLGLALADLPS